MAPSRRGGRGSSSRTCGLSPRLRERTPFAAGASLVTIALTRRPPGTRCVCPRLRLSAVRDHQSGWRYQLSPLPPPSQPSHARRTCRSMVCRLVNPMPTPPGPPRTDGPLPVPPCAISSRREGCRIVYTFRLHRFMPAYHSPRGTVLQCSWNGDRGLDCPLRRPGTHPGPNVVHLEPDAGQSVTVLDSRYSGADSVVRRPFPTIRADDPGHLVAPSSTECSIARTDYDHGLHSIARL